MTDHHRRLPAALTAAAALLLPLAVAGCTDATTSSPPAASPTTGPYEYNELEKRVAAAGFKVQPHSGYPNRDGAVVFQVDLGCSGRAMGWFSVADPDATPLRLDARITVHPAPNMVAFGSLPFSRQPTPEEVRANHLCPPDAPMTEEKVDLETEYRRHGFHIVSDKPQPDSVPGLKLDLECPDGQPRQFNFGIVTSRSLRVTIQTQLDADTVRTKSYEFTSQPTRTQVTDFGLCYSLK